MRPKTDKPTHGGKRKGAGRKPALLPVFTKKLRASDAEREEFMSMLEGDATTDFIILLNLLRGWHGRGITWAVERKKKQS
jgi:hypothetical protein